MDRSLQKVSMALTFDRAYASRVIREENLTDWETIKDLLGFLGYDPKFVYAALNPTMPVRSQKKIIHFPAAGREFGVGKGVHSPTPCA